MMRLAVAIFGIALLPLHAFTLHATPRVAEVAATRTAASVHMFGSNKWREAQAKRKEAERKQYEELAARAEAKELERQKELKERAEAEARAEEEQRARMAAYQDNVDLYRPGGVMRQPSLQLTRQMLDDATKTRSPAIDADNRVKDALSEVGTMAPAEAVELLERRIAEAREAGTSPSSPNVKKALALAATLKTGTETQADVKKTDPKKDAFDALFGSGYAPPDDSLIDLD